MAVANPDRRLAVYAMVIAAVAGSAAAQMHGKDAHAGPTMNYHEIDDRLATGGHFVDGGLMAIHDKGVEVVIDLRDRPPKDQQEKLAELGIKWISVPVVWKDPKQRDFERFVEAMNLYKDKNVLVQCQANYRASAMTYLYRVTVEQVPQDIALNDMSAIWEPEGRWREYIEGITSRTSEDKNTDRR